MIEPLEGRTLFAVSLSAVADAGVSDLTGTATTNANFGADAALPVQDAALVGVERSYLRFEIGSVPAVAGATLSLRGGLAGGGLPASVRVVAVSDVGWIEGDGLYSGLDTNNSPAGEMTFATAPARAATLDATVVGSTANYEWDVGDYVQQQKAAGATFVSFAIEAVSAGTTARILFNAREAGSGQPVLTIDEPVAVGPAATIAAPNRTEPAATHSVTVTYTDPDGVNVGTIDENDIAVARSGGGGGTVNVQSVSTSSTTPNIVVATYVLAGPGGLWDIADNGTYAVSLVPGQVTDTGGTAATGAPDTFSVNIDDATPPTAVIAADNLAAGGGSSYQFTVTYADDIAIRASTIGTGDVLVSRAGGTALTVTNVSISPPGNGSPRTVTYTIDAPGATWDAGDNGTYDVVVRANAVRDTGDNGNAEVAGTFQVQIVDTFQPTATINAPNLTTGGAPTYSFSVAYADNAAIDVNSIDANDVTVTGPNGPLVVTGFSVSSSTSGTPRTATYTVAAPGGSWDAGDNGDYTASVVAGQVADTTGNVVAASSDTFRVNIRNTNAPTANISPVAAIIARGGANQLITVTYADDTAVSRASLDSGDLTVTRSGGAALLVTLVSVTPGADSTPLTAVYSAAAPGGSWSVGDNDTYTVTVVGGAVRDASNNASAAAQAQFAVNIEANATTIDDAFNGGDVVNTGFVAEAVATDAEGRILIAGHQGDRAGGTSQSVLQRLDRDGSLDTFFGQGGQVISAPGDNEAFYAMTIDADGRIVVAGFGGTDAAVTRFKADGTLDRKFGTGGVAKIDLGGGGDVAYGLAIASDGRIVIGGGTGGDGSGAADRSFAVARLLTTGKADANFGAAGVRTFKPANGAPGVLGGVAVAQDGSVWGAGAADGNAVAVRLDPAGNVDAGFGTAGVRTLSQLSNRTDLNGIDRTQGIALQRDGKLLVGNQTAGGDFAVVRLNADGSADSGFGGDGLATVDFGGDDDVDTLCLQATGQIIAVGTSDAGGTAKTAVAAFNADGSPDEDFAQAGLFMTDAGITVGERALHIGQFILRGFGGLQRDGRLLVGAGDQSAAPSSSPLRRLLLTGSGSAGRFGNVEGKNRKLVFIDNDGTRVTVSLKGAGDGELLYNGLQADLILSGTDASTTVTVASKGGEDGRLSLRNLRADGALKAFAGKSVDVAGTFSVNGAAGKVAIGSLSGVFASAGSIASLAVAADVTNARILAGADLGEDGLLGGEGEANRDAFAAASIGTFTVGGALTGSIVAAGLNPVNGVFLDGNDQVEGGAASIIRTIAVKRSTDDATRFVAGAFGKARLPLKANPVADAHFQVL